MILRCIWLMALAAMAAPPPAAPEPATRPATLEPSPATSPSDEDPTHASERFRGLLGPGGTGRSAAPLPGLPRVIKRAFIDVENHAPEAIIEIEGCGSYVIMEGSTATVTARAGVALTFRVARLSANEIELQVPATGQAVVVR